MQADSARAVREASDPPMSGGRRSPQTRAWADWRRGSMRELTNRACTLRSRPKWACRRAPDHAGALLERWLAQCGMTSSTIHDRPMTRARDDEPRGRGPSWRRASTRRECRERLAHLLDDFMLSSAFAASQAAVACTHRRFLDSTISCPRRARARPFETRSTASRQRDRLKRGPRSSARLRSVRQAQSNSRT